MRRTTRTLAAIGLLMVSIGAAQAVTWQVTGGVLTGATGVNVGGTLYDVDFVDGSCSALFDGCDSAADFAFTTIEQASLASWALLDQVLLDIAGIGQFDSNPALTLGCAGTPNLCVILTPIAVLGTSFGSVGAYNEIGIPYPYDRVGAGGGGPIGYDFTLQNGTTLARWRLAGDSRVPEPGTIALLAIGLAVLGLSRGRRAI